MAIDQLPPDQFNVIVENEMDRLRLLWLVNKIGEAKLRNGVAKYMARWPGDQPFVSTMLKWYGLKVPVEVYAPHDGSVRIPVYWLYLLWLADGSKIKVGMTGDWPWRAYAFVKLRRKINDTFDVDRSRAFLVGGSKAEVLRRERAVKSKFAAWNVGSPWPDGWVYYSAGGHGEWFDGAIWEDLVGFASTFDETNQVVQTLRTAVAITDAECESHGGPLVLRDSSF
jgi:hypothetical protein